MSAPLQCLKIFNASSLETMDPPRERVEESATATTTAAAATVETEKTEGEEQSHRYTPLDLLHALWNRDYSSGRNMRLILAFVTRFMIVQGRTNPAMARVKEANTIRETLIELYDIWTKEDTLSRRVSARQMNDLASSWMLGYASLSSLDQDLMGISNFRDWLRDYRDHARRTLAAQKSSLPPEASVVSIHSQPSCSGVRIAAVNATPEAGIAGERKRDDGGGGGDEDNERERKRKRTNDNEEEEEEKEEGNDDNEDVIEIDCGDDDDDNAPKKRGLDSLLDDDFETERSDPISSFPQNISQLRNGRLCTLKTPGERGSQLIRLQLFDTKNIAKKEVRNWWKYAKVRTQFLMTPEDRRQRLLQQLLDETADDLIKIPGTAKDVRSFCSDG